VGLLGILKAGGAYVPLDPTYPAERLSYMLADARVKVLLTQQALISSVPASEAKVVCLDSDWIVMDSQHQENPVVSVFPGNLAYVIYTSGSTGQPKGVSIEHRSLVNFTKAAIDEYQLTNADCLLQFASISFDAAAEEIYSCLSVGGTLTLRTTEMLSDATTFLSACAQLNISVVDLPTAYWYNLLRESVLLNLAWPQSLRLVIIGGESVIPTQVQMWQKHIGTLPKLVNSYGPTEATVVTTIVNLSLNATSDTLPPKVSIGRPIANTQTYILDRNLQPLPIGIAGELHIGGNGLARGYLNRPELTQEKFIPNPFVIDSSSRLYKTGDLACYLPDGNIEFLGRIDHQVKIRGFRIELGEIESVLNTHPQIKQAFVIANEDNQGYQRLIAYVVSDKQSLTSQQLREYLKQQLPSYMVPNAYVTLESLPLTSNGKIDRKALPDVDVLTQSSVDFVTARNITEEILVDIWRQVLQVENISIYDNFFDLGGHSLIATQINSRISKELNLKLPLKTLFEETTVAGLAEKIDNIISTMQSFNNHSKTVTASNIEEGSI
jgi:amino acid adenylation domain-containing protein